MTRARTIAEFLRYHAAARPDAPALLTAGRAPLSFAGLQSLVEKIADTLRENGLSGRRIALIAPPGPELAVAFLGITITAACAPLNPAYREAELAFYLDDLDVAALIVMQDFHQAAERLARDKGVPILRMQVAAGAAAGGFKLLPPIDRVSGSATGNSDSDAEAEALLLHTSGTTARPKLVPLTHANLCASARHIQTTLALTADDRCLSAMPLFHIHGLVAALLSSLYAGGSLYCLPGFLADSFLDALAPSAATWITAVPTMLQAIWRAAEARPQRTNGTRLRFIRSSSAPLPPVLMQQLERTFGAPVIEAYGMTEASHQMASNPLPPGIRKPGSVGRAAGPEVAIRRPDGSPAPIGEPGEIVVRGPNLMRAYANQPAANSVAFFDRWFRTGDLGRLDQDGYLYLIGRTKELINRGGEKISPREVDEALLEHPAVLQAVSFAVPHHSLGEAVAAAVVLRHDESESALRAFVAQRLAPWKVPARVFIVDELPKGPTGKVLRIGLAARLGIGEAELVPPSLALPLSPQVEPETPRQKRLLALFHEILGHDAQGPPRLGIHDDFFLAGGDSMAALRLLERIRLELGARIALPAFYAQPTVAGLDRAGDQPRADDALLTPLRLTGRDGTLLAVCSATGDLSGILNLGRALHPRWSIVGCGLPSTQETPRRYRIEDLSRRILDELGRLDAPQPYFLLGTCSGGQLAFETAAQLRRSGARVELVTLIDCYNVAVTEAASPVHSLRLQAGVLLQRARYQAAALRKKRARQALQYLTGKLQLLAQTTSDRLKLLAFRAATAQTKASSLMSSISSMSMSMSRWLAEPRHAIRQAVLDYRPPRLDARLLLLRCEEPRAFGLPDAAMGWREHVASPDALEVVLIPHSHRELLSAETAPAIAALIEQRMH